MATELKHIRELRRKLAQYRINVTRTETTRGSHVRVHMAKDGHEGALIHSASPSDQMAQQAFVSRARRLLRGDP
jgi:hypothetical protein